MPETKDVTIKLKVELSERSWPPRSGWHAELGSLTASGKTKAGTLAELAGFAAAVFERGDDQPVFARDDGGALIVVIPDVISGGFGTWRITDDGARFIESGAGDAARHVEQVLGWTEVPKR